jgi:hypothetical protein
VFTAAADAQELVRSSHIVSTAGAVARTSEIVVRVSRGEGFLPRELTQELGQLGPLTRQGGFGGRTTMASKQALMDAYGGTPESERAVAAGLFWLHKHQQADGRWFLWDYARGHAGCDCFLEMESDVLDYDTAGTSFALLPFLGAGITHKSAPEFPPPTTTEMVEDYKKTVEKGLKFLVAKQNKSNDPKKSGYLGDNIYSHALGTMVLCEAYALTQDEDLKVPASRAIGYILRAQHPSGGGWRYSFQTPGDMSVTGWMFLAIRTAQLAGLTVESTPLTRSERFIDSCAAGPPEARLSQYSYTPDQPPKLAMTAAGLLTREYLKWDRDNPDLVAGSEYLMKQMPPESGTSLGAMYTYYYATQVLHHREGSDFDLWNHRMREHLIRTQERKGHQTGSWSPQGVDQGAKGGRLYATSLALMTLEVYYRHLPMYTPVLRAGGSLRLGASDAPPPADAPQLAGARISIQSPQ